MSLLLASSFITSATAEEVGVTINVQENQDPEDLCVNPPTNADWSPSSFDGPDIIATPGQAASFGIAPNFVAGSGFVAGVCDTPIAPTGLVQASIALTGNPAGWESSVLCTATCPTSDFFEEPTLIVATVTPPNVFGMAYNQGVVVTVTWTP